MNILTRVYSEISHIFAIIDQVAFEEKQKPENLQDEGVERVGGHVVVLWRLLPLALPYDVTRMRCRIWTSSYRSNRLLLLKGTQSGTEKRYVEQLDDDPHCAESHRPAAYRPVYQFLRPCTITKRQTDAEILFSFEITNNSAASSQSQSFNDWYRLATRLRQAKILR